MAIHPADLNRPKKDSTGLSGPMTMTVSPDTVGPGVVTFTIRNAGTIRHQLLVVRTSAAVLTPGANQRVSEHGAVGAIRLLRPGVITSLTVELTAGKYQLLCNLPGHDARGLHVPLTVT